MNNLSILITEDIDSDFGYGTYGNLRLIISKKDGYVNIESFPNGKHHDWDNKDTSDSMYVIAQEVAILQSISIDKLRRFYDGMYIQKELRGVYIHPLMVPHFAIRCSPFFATKASQMMNNLLIETHLKKMEEEKLFLESHNHLLLEQQEKMEEQKVKMNEQITMMEEKEKEIESLKKALKHKNRIEENGLGNTNINEHLQRISHTVALLQHNIVKNDKENLIEYFALIRNPNDFGWRYHMINIVHTRISRFDRMIRKYQNLFPEAEVVYRYESQYNPARLNASEIIGCKLPTIFEVSGKNINIPEGSAIQEETLIESIKDIIIENIKQVEVDGSESDLEEDSEPKNPPTKNHVQDFEEEEMVKPSAWNNFFSKFVQSADQDEE